MPGIFGAVAADARRNPLPIAEAMSTLLTHQPWFGCLLSPQGPKVFGAVSTSPWFTESGRLADAPDARLLVEGTAITVDGTPLPDDSPDLARKLLNTYLESGDGFARRVGGHFNLVVEDRRKETVQLINDRLGFAHLFWYVDDDIFLFGPELKAFLAWRGMDHTLDPGAFGSMIAAQVPLGPHTFFQRVKMLSPATRVTWHQGEVSVDRYWRPEVEPVANRSDEDLLEEALALYQRSVAKRVPSGWQGRMVIPLSGGLDSRLLLWLNRHHGDRLDLVTHGQPGCTDALIAGQTAAALGLDQCHRLVEIDPDWAGTNARQAVWLNDGQVNLRNATLVGICNKIGPEAVPFMNGIIGAFMSLGVGGFVGRDELGPIDDQDLLRQKLLGVTGLGRSRQRLGLVMPPGEAERLAALADQQAWEAFDDVQHVGSWGDQKIIFVNSNLGRRMQGTVDVNRHFFHDLLPFVDDDLYRFWLTIPLERRLGNQLYHELYRRYLPDLARVPWSYTRLDLFADEQQAQAAVAALARRQKRRRLLSKYTMGLVNISSRERYLHRERWLRRNTLFRSFMKETLRDVNATGCPWFDQRLVDRLFRRFDRGGDHHLLMLLQVATVIIWHDLYLENRTDGKELADLPPEVCE